MLKKLLLLLASCAFSLAVIEGAVRLFESRIQAIGAVERVSDPKLGAKVAPNARGHDARGFRNPSVPDRADLVAIGDSQTWGQNAELNETWPYTVGQLSGMSVYNMGVSGYGPVEYVTLAPDALKLGPKTLVVGLYFGNDLWDAYHSAYFRDGFADLRDASLIQSLNRDTVAEAAEVSTREFSQRSDQIRTASTPAWIRWLGRHSAIGRQLSYRGRWPGSTLAARNAAQLKAITADPTYGLSYDSEHTHTILTTFYRLVAVDRSEPRIIEGLRITKICLSRIKEMASAVNARLIVVLIPTKELVYADQVKSLNRVDRTYASLIENETADRNEIRQYCQERQIRIADALPALAGAAQRDEVIYPQFNDSSHPNSLGYRLIAEVVSEALRQS